VVEASPFGEVFLSEPFQKWCTQELQRITGSDDMTLVYFLMSLQSEAEIREYAQNYLGTTKQAKSFVNDFVRRKASESAFLPGLTDPGLAGTARVEENRSVQQKQHQQQQQQQQGATGKKGKKTQKAAPQLLGFLTPGFEGRDVKSADSAQ